MPPSLVPKDPVLDRRLDAAEKSTEWFLKHRDEYRGKFIVIHEGKFVAADEDPRQAKDLARRAGVDLRQSIIEFVPEDDQNCFY